MTHATSRPGETAALGTPERRAALRLQLIEIGLELFGTAGYHATTISDICAAASINRRYFYECYRDREALLQAVYDDIVAELARQIFETIARADDIEGKVEAGMTGFWTMMTSDPRKARVLTVEVVGVSDALEQHRRRTRTRFAEFVDAQALAVARASGWAIRINPELTARNLIAAMLDLLVDWMRGDVDYTAGELAAHGIQFYSVASSGVFYDPADPERNVVRIRHSPDDPR